MIGNPLLLAIFFLGTIDCLWAQNPPISGDLFAPRGERRSPNGKFEWRVRDLPPMRYELINLATGKPIAVVASYYSSPGDSRYAHAVGVYWNSESTVVALDELNRRRAGYLYFFVVHNSTAKGMRAERMVPVPTTVDEARLVVDPGWITPGKVRVRLTEKFPARTPESKFYLIDFSDPENPKASLD